MKTEHSLKVYLKCHPVPELSHIFVPEMNMGQMILEVERVVKNNCKVTGINKFNGDIITPQDITSCIEEVYSYAK